MTKQIDLSKPLEGFDAQYVRDRPWIQRDAELEGIEIVFADDIDGDFEVEDEADDDEDNSGESDEDTEGDEEDSEDEEVEEIDYEAYKVPELVAEIEARNEDREEADQIVPDTSKKSDLIAALIADDEK